MNQLMHDVQSSLCRFIGELLLESGLVTEEQLSQAVQTQHETGELLGQILVRQHAISQAKLVDLLKIQLTQRLNEQHINHHQLGEILLSFHAISRWQLSQALQIQSDIPKKIGQLLIDLGYTSRGNVEQALSHQVVGKCKTDCCHQRRSLGELLLQANRVTPTELESALRVQKQTQAYLGDILVQQGILNEEELEDLLASQLILSCQHADSNKEDIQPIYRRLGEILVETHQITPAQLESAVAEQQKSLGRKLGDILVEKGLVPLKELLRALRLQERLSRLTMTTVTGLAVLTACGVPNVPMQQSLDQWMDYQIRTQAFNPAAAKLAVSRKSETQNYKILQVENGSKIQIDKNGSRSIAEVPFVHQGNDNTCGQAVMTALLQFWGDPITYQGVVYENNPRNMPTTDKMIANYLRKKGLQAQPYRGATLENLIAQINKGRPTVVLLDFGGISQEHYVIVVGYNPEKNTVIMHDSLEGPYIEIKSSVFMQMWDNQALRNVHVFGGENYRRLMIDIHK